MSTTITRYIPIVETMVAITSTGVMVSNSIMSSPFADPLRVTIVRDTEATWPRWYVAQRGGASLGYVG